MAKIGQWRDEILPLVVDLVRAGLSNREVIMEVVGVYPAISSGQVQDIIDQVTASKKIEMGRRRIAGIKDLMDAIWEGNLQKVKELLDKGADIEDKYDGETALIQSVRTGSSTEIVKLLLDQGADLNAKDNDGWTALMWVAYYGRIGIVKLLLDQGADVNVQDRNGKTALMWAEEGGHIGILKLLLDKGADVNAKNNDGKTALALATKSHRTEIVDLLKQHGATARRHRMENRRTADADLDEGGWTMISNDLIRATANRDLQKVKELLDQGADINARDKQGSTALIWATDNGDTDIVKLLLDRGADVNIKDNDGWTAFDVAFSLCRTAIADLLRQHGAMASKKKVTEDTVMEEMSDKDDLFQTEKVLGDTGEALEPIDQLIDKEKTMGEKNSSTPTEKLDEKAKEYWDLIMKDLGVSKGVLKGALDAINAELDAEPDESEEQLITAEKNLEKVYNSYGADFVRLLRMAVLSSKLKKFGVSSIVARHVPKSVVEAMAKRDGFCKHYASDHGMFHFGDKKEFDEICSILDAYTVSYLPVSSFTHTDLLCNSRLPKAQG